MKKRGSIGQEHFPTLPSNDADGFKQATMPEHMDLSVHGFFLPLPQHYNMGHPMELIGKRFAKVGTFLHTVHNQFVEFAALGFLLLTLKTSKRN